MFIIQNNIVNEIASCNSVSPVYVRKVLIGLYSKILNELLFEGKTNDFIFDISFDKNNKEVKIIKINDNFLKILEGKLNDSDLIKDVVEESDIV